MSFRYYSPYTVNSGQVPSAQTDFPMLVSVTDSRFKTVGNGGHVQSSNGYDIRPYSDAALTTPLTYELERYNASTGEVIMHVKRSSISDGTVTYLAYGDVNVGTDGSSSATWSNGYKFVYHLANGSSLSLSDSSGGNFTLTNTNSAAATSGKIDGAVSIVDASNQELLNTASSCDPGTDYTLSAWINITSFAHANVTPVYWYLISGFNHFKQIEVQNTGKLDTGLTSSGGVFIGYNAGTTTLTTSTWYHVVNTYNSTLGFVGYVNATQDGTAAANGNPSTTDNFCIGNDKATSPRRFDGVVDEVRGSTVVRSANWITTEYNNQNAPGTFATLGTEQDGAIFGGIYRI